MTRYFIWEQTDSDMDVKVGKAGAHMICIFWYDGESCTRYLETYLSLHGFHLLAGTLSKEFVCNAAFPFCANLKIKRRPAQDYVEFYETSVKLPELAANNFQDDFYLKQIRDIGGS